MLRRNDAIFHILYKLLATVKGMIEALLWMIIRVGYLAKP